MAGGPPRTDFGSILKVFFVIFFNFRQICKPLEVNVEAFLWGRLSRNSTKKKEERKIKNALVAPCILLASGTGSAGRVPASREDRNLI